MADIFNKTFERFWGTWVAQSAEHLTLGFGSGHDLLIHGIEPCIRLCANSMEPALDSLCPFLCPCPACTCMCMLLLSK